MKKGSKNKGSKSVGSRIKDFFNKYKKPILIVVIGGPSVYLAYRGYKHFANKTPALPMMPDMPPVGALTGSENSVPNTLEQFLAEETVTTSSGKKPLQKETVALQETGDLSSVSFDF